MTAPARGQLSRLGCLLGIVRLYYSRSWPAVVFEQANKPVSNRRTEMVIENRLCRLCDLYRGCKTVCLGGTGQRKAVFVVVNESPERAEDEKGQLGHGRYGQILDKALVGAGINKKFIYFTNVIRCRPPENCSPSNLQVTMCRGYLLREVEFIAPQAIICLGRTAVTGFLPHFDKHIKDGQFHAGHWKTKPVYYTYSPSAVSRNSMLLDTVVNSLRSIRIETEKRLQCDLR